MFLTIVHVQMEGWKFQVGLGTCNHSDMNNSSDWSSYPLEAPLVQYKLHSPRRLLIPTVPADRKLTSNVHALISYTRLDSCKYLHLYDYNLRDVIFSRMNTIKMALLFFICTAKHVSLKSSLLTLCSKFNEMLITT